MKYWDTSALVPLVVREPGTELVRGYLDDDPEIVTWALSRVEVTSAIERRTRDGTITRASRRQLLDEFDTLFDAWDEVVDLLAVRKQAERLLARHPLRTADAMQLSSALLVAGAEPRSFTMVCLDTRLAEAAEGEGLRVETWPEP